MIINTILCFFLVQIELSPVEQREKLVGSEVIKKVTKEKVDQDHSQGPHHQIPKSINQ